MRAGSYRYRLCGCSFEDSGCRMNCSWGLPGSMMKWKEYEILKLEELGINPSFCTTSCVTLDMKSSTQGTTLKQQGFHEVHRKRTFLQDNSWIKKRPEEERKVNDEPKATISRYRSDDALDRISDRNDTAKTCKANTLENRLTNRNVHTFKLPEAAKTQPRGLFSTNTANTPASTSAATPGKKKRQSWFPPPPPGYNITASTGASRREPTVHPPVPPKPSSPISSPNQLRHDNRSQDLGNIVKVATSLQKTDKGEEIDNVIKMNKSLNRNQGLDGLFRANPKAELTEKRAKSLENLIFMNTRTDKEGKGKQDPNGLTKVNPETNANIKRGHSLDNLIKMTPKVNRSNPGSNNLNCLIKVDPKTEKNGHRGQSFDSLIKVAPEKSRTNQGEEGLAELINVSPKAVKNTAGNEDLDKLIRVNPETLTNNRRNQDLDLIKVNPAVIRSNQRDQDMKNLTEVNSNVSKNKNGSSRAETMRMGPKNTVVYTRAYVENSKSPKERYQENISGKYIQTVYSTSDRSIIERDMCTYCRKPLGTETKMILDELQICCHSTCFKCEICKQPLENLQAGDSIWIYRQTIHCEPCYSKVMAKWIQ
ncbi:sciellin isoform X2 [Manis pentadactyla]|uniref:sciellin isoform X2 n=2 Tax=Manis pentadactyla TaxID=143292 RepID=UPI00255C3E3C|nr:sciellin isoform X2 [Manis pentadactyla]